MRTSPRQRHHDTSLELQVVALDVFRGGGLVSTVWNVLS